MKQNIQKIFRALSPEGKRKAVAALADAFKMSEDSIKNFWLYGEPRIPEEKQLRALEIVRATYRLDLEAKRKVLEL